MGKTISSAAAFVLSVGLAGCAALGPVYDAVAPPTQLDHEWAEFGDDAVKGIENESALGKIEGTDFSFQRPTKLEKGRKTYLILQVDGGGIMGITPAGLVARIEAALQERSGFENGKLKDLVSICSGTSTGAIITGAVAAGVPARAIAEFYEVGSYELFRDKGRLPLAPIFQYRFNREAFQEEMIATLEEYADYPPTVRLGEMDEAPLLILAAYDLVDKRTVFLRNRDNFDAPVNTGEVQLIDAIGASALSATVYFGKLAAPEIRLRHLNADGQGYETKGAIFADGGQGTQNTTLLLAALEGLRLTRADPEAQVVLISLGCGNDYGEREFKEVRRFRDIDHITDFLFRGHARSESILLQWMAAMKLAEIEDRLKVFRFDWHHPSSKDATSFSINEKQRRFLIEKAGEIAARDDFKQLMCDLADDRLRLKQYRP